MRRRFIAAFLAAGLSAALFAQAEANVRFDLRATVSPVCQIDQQSAALSGASAIVDLEVTCNVSAFTLSAPGANRVKLEEYQLLGAATGAPVIHESRHQVDFADLKPGRHLIRLRITAPGGQTELVLETL